MKKIILFALLTCFHVIIIAQTTDSLIKDTLSNGNNYATLTFKTTRVVIGQSIENVNAGDLHVVVSHHFGRLNQGGREFFGLTTSTIRLGLDYGFTRWLTAGIGLSTYEKTLDGSVKCKLLRQCNVNHNMPVSLSYYGQVDVNTSKWQFPAITNYFSLRLTYASQLIVARKFNKSLSLQLVPSFIHYNFVQHAIDQNNVFAIGGGGRYKITKHTSINLEYYYLMPGQAAKDYVNSLSVGFDIETGGHVFQLFFTNSQPLIERGFIAETKGKWSMGDIYFGFNINRIFTL